MNGRISTVHPQPYAQWEAAALRSEDQAWLIPGFLPANALTLIAGRPKYSCKSWVAYTMAFAASSGTAIGPFRPTASYPTLYIDLEGVAKATAQRRGLMSAGGMAMPEMDTVPMWISHGEPFDLNDDKHMDTLMHFILVNEIKVVFIDTLAKAASGVEENSAKEVGELLQSVDRIKRAECAVVLVHHLRKAFKHEAGATLDATSGLRGSGALEGGFDHIVSATTAMVDDEQRNFWITGGKFTTWEAYEADWSFQPDVSARLTFKHLGDIPVVDVPARKPFGKGA